MLEPSLGGTWFPAAHGKQNMMCRFYLMYAFNSMILNVWLMSWFAWRKDEYINWSLEFIFSKASQSVPLSLPESILLRRISAVETVKSRGRPASLGGFPFQPSEAHEQPSTSSLHRLIPLCVPITSGRPNRLIPLKLNWEEVVNIYIVAMIKQLDESIVRKLCTEC